MDGITAIPAAEAVVPRPGLSRWRTATFAAVFLAVVVLTERLSQSALARARGQLVSMKIFDHLFVRYDRPSVAVVVGAIVAAAIGALVVPAAWFDRMARRATDHPRIFAGTVFVLLGAGARFAYGYPLSMDEYAQYFQAQIFAAGHLTGHFPPDLRSLLLPLGFFIKSTNDGQVLSQYWPGFPLLLAPFMRLGAPWLLNPLFGAAAVLLVRHLATKLWPDTPQAAGWAMILLAASPAFSVNAMSYYTMNVYLTLGLAYAALLLEPTPRRLFAAGVLGSVALAQHNPVPHALFALPWLVWLAWGPGRARRLLWIGLGYVALTLPIVAGWFAFKTELLWPGNLVRAAVNMIASTSNRVLGLPDARLLGARVMTGIKLYLWWVPGLPVLALFGLRRVRSQVGARLLCASAIVTYVPYLFLQFDQGHGWGDRYFHPAAGILPLLGAAWVTEKEQGFRWASFVGMLSVSSLLVLTPLRLWQVHDFIQEAKSMAPVMDPARKQVAFVDIRPGGGRLYPQDAIRNDPFLRGGSMMFRSVGADQDARFMQRQFPAAKRISLTSHGSVWDLEPR